MKKFLKFFSISLLVILILPFLLLHLAKVRAGTTGLLAAYSLDAGSGSTAADASGNNYTGTVSGATWTTAGKYGSALSFDGINDLVSGSSIALPATFTLMAWVNNPTDEAYETIVTIGEFRDLYLGSGFITFYDGAADYTFGTKLTNNVWRHVALTYDGTNLRAYLDGVQQGSAQPSTLYSVTAPIQVGAWIDEVRNDDFFRGLIDEVRVYNRALAQSEIQADMNSPITPGSTTPTPSPATPTITPTPSVTPTSVPTSTPPVSVTPTPSVTVTPASSPLPTPLVNSPSPGNRPRPSAYSLKEGYTMAAFGSNDPDIYIVNDAGFKRLFLNPVIFGFYGHLGGFKYVNKIVSTTRDVFETSGLFRNCETNDPKIYALEITGEDIGVLHHLNLAGSQALAEDPEFFQKVFCINNNEFNWYTQNGKVFSSDYTSTSQMPKYKR